MNPEPRGSFDVGGPGCSKKQPHFLVGKLYPSQNAISVDMAQVGGWQRVQFFFHKREGQDGPHRHSLCKRIYVDKQYITFNLVITVQNLVNLMKCLNHNHYGVGVL